MAFQPTPYTLALVAAVLVSLPAAVLVLRRPPKRGARPLAALLATAGLWGASLLVAETVTGAAQTAWWLNFTFTGSAICVLSWFVFVLEYTGREWLVSDATLVGLSVEPAAVTVLAWTNGLHGLLFRDARAFDESTLVLQFEVAFWVHAVYSYLLLAAGAIFLGLMIYRSPELSRERAAALAVGVAGPLALTVPYGLGVSGVDVRPVGFVVAGGAFGYAMFRFDLMDVTPVAHNTIVENIRDGVFVLDRQDRVIEINPTAKEILGIDADRVVGRHASEVLSVYPGLYERYEDTVETQEEIGLDDGDRRRFFHIQVSPLYDRRNHRMGRLFLVHDITDQKRRQQELQRQNNRLDQFASLVSHDLRNPLNVADGFIDLARDTGDVEYLDRVEDSLDRMGNLIDDVLTLAREGQTITETEAVHLPDIAEEAWENVDTAEASLSVVTDATIDASHDRLLRVFENLYRNAVEHGREDVQIRVGGMGDDATGARPPDQRGFYVEDDGPGIPEDQREDVLEDGFTTSDEGTGLGLSIVTSIVGAHGWEVGVGESPEGGARFEITGVEPADADRPQQAARADGGE